MYRFVIFCNFLTLILTNFHAKAEFTLNKPGTEFPVNYSAYGEFKSLGESAYEYAIHDDYGLSEAVGDGIFPNNFTIYEDPAYIELTKNRTLAGDKWNFVNGLNTQACFIKWATVEDEDPGVKLFYTAHNLERAGLVKHAVKAYYACLVHFPRAIGYTYWGTPWYVGVVSLDKIQYLCRTFKEEIGYQLMDAHIFVENGFDTDVANDVFFIDPGKFVANENISYPEKNFSDLKIIRTLGGKHGTLVQYENGDWQFQIDGKPILFKSISYQPAPVGQSYDEGTMQDWMLYDSDKNGIADSPFESFMDTNENNIQDSNEPSEGDFKLLKDMGVNVLRLYHHAASIEVLRQGYEKYGLRYMIGDLIGMYNVGSGASWEEGTDYRNPIHKKNMLNSVRDMVNKYKDEPGVCLWVLGNENNYGGVFGHHGGVGNAGAYPKEYYEFVNEAAKLIKSLDTTRPVAICNGETGFLDIFAKLCPDVDIFGPNSYRGSHGFGPSMWEWAKKVINRPVLVMEYGCPGFHQGISMDIAYKEQSSYLENCWNDIVFHSYQGHGAGTALGGVVFQWVDGWWKSGQPPRFSPIVHETVGQWPGPFPDGWSYEEWFGMCGQGNGTKSPFLRQPRPVYYMHQKIWNES